MKHNYLKSLFLMLMMCVGMSAWAETYTITFKTNTSDGSTEIAANAKVSNVVSKGASYVSGFTSTCSKAYYNCTSGVKLGSSNAAGILEFNIATNYQSNIKSITVKSVKYGSDTGTISLYSGSTSLKTGITPGTDYTHTFSTATTVSSIKLSTSSKRAYISEIVLETDGEPVSIEHEISVNGTTHSSCSLSVSPQKAAKDATITVTANPGTGYEFSQLSIKKKGENPSIFDAVNASYTETNGKKTGATFTMPDYDVDLYGVFTESTPKAKYLVTIITPENGTLTIKDGETIVNSGEEVEEGKTLTVVVDPADGYRFKNWGYKDGDANWVGNMTSTFTHEMPSAPCSFKATFEEIPTYTVAFSVNGGIVKSDDLKEGSAVKVPAVENINGKVFTGWVTTETVDADATPTYVTPSETAVEAATYYAVFAIVDGEGEDQWIEITSIPEAGTYAICSDNYFMSSNISSNRFVNGNAPQIENGKLTEAPASNCIWEISKPDKYYRIKNGSNYAAGTSSKNQGALITDESEDLAKWEISYAENQYSIVNYGRAHQTKDNANCYLRNNSTYGWGTYTSSTGNAPRLFKKEGGTTYSDFTTTPSILVLDENDESIAEIYDEYDKVVVKRTIKANTWSTLCLPFAMDPEQVAANFGEDAEVKILTGLAVNGTSYTMNFDDCDEIGAALPCMIRVSKPISEIVVEGKVEVNTTEKSEDTAENGDDLITFVGSYTKSSVAPNDGNYIISSNKFYYVDSTVTNKGFRGYFNLFTLDAAVKSLSMSFDNDADAILMVENKKYDTKIFNLQGQRVDKAQKGIYIINGRKVVK